VKVSLTILSALASKEPFHGSLLKFNLIHAHDIHIISHTGFCFFCSNTFTYSFSSSAHALLFSLLNFTLEACISQLKYARPAPADHHIDTYHHIFE
jgi:hypothetical protein